MTDIKADVAEKPRGVVVRGGGFLDTFRNVHSWVLESDGDLSLTDIGGEIVVAYPSGAWARVGFMDHVSV